jgi:hypothetical protein
VLSDFKEQFSTQFVRAVSPSGDFFCGEIDVRFSATNRSSHRREEDRKSALNVNWKVVFTEGNEDNEGDLNRGLRG